MVYFNQNGLWDTSTFSSNTQNFSINAKVDAKEYWITDRQYYDVLKTHLDQQLMSI